MTPTEAEAYLRRMSKPEDEWLLGDGRPWWLVSMVEGRLFGLDAESVRRLLQRGQETKGAEGIPDGVLISQQAGWRIPRSGLLVYLARTREQQERRAC